MDTLLILKRPIKIPTPNKKNKLTKSKSRKLWPSAVKVAKNGEGPQRMNQSCETILENTKCSETERVSFVSLYHDLCCENGGSDPQLSPRSVTTFGAGAGDHVRRPIAHVVMEIDY